MLGNNLNKGQSIWEVVIALGIAGLVALGLVKVTTMSIKGSRFSSDQSKITALAQKKFAEVIDYKNKNPSFWTEDYPNHFDAEVYDAGEGYCIATDVSDASSKLPDTTPNYGEALMAKITVAVFWDEITAGEYQCDGKTFSHSLNFDTYVVN